MRQSLKTLLADSLDYAGMYPPASLSLEESFAKYMNYRQHEHAWMLARFVCPVDCLVDLESLLETSSSPAMRLSVIGRSAPAPNGWLASVEEDFQRIKRFLDRIGERTRIESYERVLPPEFAAQEQSPKSSLDQICREFARSGAKVFFQISPGDRLTKTFTQLMAIAGSHNCSVKLRTGGTEAFLFPSPAEVANFIVGCREANLTWKATAGLHEPLGEMDHRLNVWRFGFLNLFGATVLAHAHRLSPERIEPILREPEAAAFRFSDDAFSWRDLSATTEQIAAARKSSLLSFGSCSFEEPIDGLRRMGLL